MLSTTIKASVIGMTLLISNLASANPTAELGTCLVDALNGKERKQLAKWIFFSIASHPEITSFANVTEKDIEDTNQTVGHLITRLLTKDCPSQMTQANADNPLALQQSFELVGQVAMQELMSNPKVNSAIVGYSKYADLDKINSLLVK